MLGEPAESLMVNVPSVSLAPKVRAGAAFERVNGLAPERVTTPEAVTLVAPAIAPALVSFHLGLGRLRLAK